VGAIATLFPVRALAALESVMRLVCWLLTATVPRPPLVEPAEICELLVVVSASPAIAVVLPLCALVAVSGTSTASGSGVPDPAAAGTGVRDATTVGVVDPPAIEAVAGLGEAPPVADATAVDEVDTVALAVAEFALVCVIAVPLTVTGVPPTATAVALAPGVGVTDPLGAVALFTPPAMVVAVPADVFAEVADGCVGSAVPPVGCCA
jgi:hypothetical protein